MYSLACQHLLISPNNQLVTYMLYFHIHKYMYCDFCNILHPFWTHLKYKSNKISFFHNIHFYHQIILQFCAEYGSITAELCAKLQNDWTTDE